jgi:cytochrome c
MLWLAMLGGHPAAAQEVLRGHGGPVRALAVEADGGQLVSGSFDSTVIVWDLERSAARRVLRFHQGAVNAVVMLADGCFASAGEDRRIALWCGEADQPVRVLEGHEAAVKSLAARGGVLVSASFDGTVRRWPLAGGGGPEIVHRHQGAATAVTIAGDAAVVVSAGSDGVLLSGEGAALSRLQTTAPAAVLAGLPGGDVVAASVDGHVRIVSADLQVRAEILIDRIPVASLAVSPDGRLIAAAGLRGSIAIIDRAQARIVHRLTGPGLPVWSLVFDRDSRTLISGGADRVIRRWDAVAGKALTSTLPERDIVAEAAASGERGAVVFRACQACHTLSPDDGNRAGPTLHGVFGRRIGTAPGYVYSEALPRMSIVWSRETIARLFEIGPNAYTPGTKMPEQTITDPADREALVEWLERVTVGR